MKSKKLIETGGLESINKPNPKINKHQDDIVRNIQVDNIIDDLIDVNNDITQINSDIDDINTTISSLEHNDLSSRDVAGNHSKLIPSANSTTAVQITKADGTTAILNVDSTNSLVGIGVNAPKSKLDVNGGVKIANDTDVASADKVGTLRYRLGTEESFIDVCMQTGDTTYAWVNIITQSWVR